MVDHMNKDNRALDEMGMFPQASNAYKQEVATDYPDYSDNAYHPDPTPDSKHWYESKTMWFNGIMGALALIISILDPLMPSLEQYMTAENFGLLLALVNLINAVLRKYTHQAIKGGGRE